MHRNNQNGQWVPTEPTYHPATGYTTVYPNMTPVYYVLVNANPVHLTQAPVYHLQATHTPLPTLFQQNQPVQPPILAMRPIIGQTLNTTQTATFFINAAKPPLIPNATPSTSPSANTAPSPLIPMAPTPLTVQNQPTQIQIRPMQPITGPTHLSTAAHSPMLRTTQAAPFTLSTTATPFIPGATQAIPCSANDTATPLISKAPTTLTIVRQPTQTLIPAMQPLIGPAHWSSTARAASVTLNTTPHSFNPGAIQSTPLAVNNTTTPLIPNAPTTLSITIDNLYKECEKLCMNSGSTIQVNTFIKHLSEAFQSPQFEATLTGEDISKIFFIIVKLVNHNLLKPSSKITVPCRGRLHGFSSGFGDIGNPVDFADEPLNLAIDNPIKPAPLHHQFTFITHLFTRMRHIITNLDYHERYISNLVYGLARMADMDLLPPMYLPMGWLLDAMKKKIETSSNPAHYTSIMIYSMGLLARSKRLPASPLPINEFIEIVVNTINGCKTPVDAAVNMINGLGSLAHANLLPTTSSLCIDKLIKAIETAIMEHENPANPLAKLFYGLGLIAQANLLPPIPLLIDGLIRAIEKTTTRTRNTSNDITEIQEGLRLMRQSDVIGHETYHDYLRRLNKLSDVESILSDSTLSFSLFGKPKFQAKTDYNALETVPNFT